MEKNLTPNQKIEKLELLKLSKNNTKLKLMQEKTYSFDIPAGYTCPNASQCLSFSNRINGKITDGKNCSFRCYAASQEARYKNTRLMRWYNLELILSCNNNIEKMVNLIQKSINYEKFDILRIHSSGDFFTENYFKAWLIIAKNNPNIKFFGYTKILKYVEISKNEKIDNFKIVYSIGGIDDKNYFSMKNDIPACQVATDNNNAMFKIACDEKNPVSDYDFIMQEKSFSILLHGTQPAKK